MPDSTEIRRLTKTELRDRVAYLEMQLDKKVATIVAQRIDPSEHEPQAVPEDLDEIEQRILRALSRFVFPGHLVNRASMAWAIVAALTGGEDYADLLPARSVVARDRDRPERYAPPEESDACRIVRTVVLGPKDYGWHVVSDCGVVKLYSSRDGCMIALNSTSARRLADELHGAIGLAADSVDRASCGGER